MKNLSLKMQIWLVLAGVTLGFTIVSSILFPVILRDFFTTETYDTIDRSQELLENLYQTKLDDEFMDQEFFNSMRSELDGEGSVNHLLMSEDGDLITSTDLPQEFINEVEGNEMLENLQSGDQVVTIGGLHGTIKTVDDEKITLIISDDTHITIGKFGVQKVVNQGE